jgi:hypothetical protein
VLSPKFSFFCFLAFYNLPKLQQALLFYKYSFTPCALPLNPCTSPNLFIFSQRTNSNSPLVNNLYSNYFFYNFYTLFYLMNLSFKKTSPSFLPPYFSRPITSLDSLIKIDLLLFSTFEINLNNSLLLNKDFFYCLNNNFFLTKPYNLSYIYNTNFSFQLNPFLILWLRLKTFDNISSFTTSSTNSFF